MTPLVDARPDIGIARVGPSEHAALDALVREAYEHDYGPREHTLDELSFSANRARRFDVWVARDGEGRLLGSVTTPRPGGEKLMEDSADDEFDFRLLAVAVDARGRGVGQLLTRHVLALGVERGFSRVFMKSGPHMTGAHRLYEKLGFSRDPARDGLVIGGARVLDLFAFTIRLDDPSPEDRP